MKSFVIAALGLLCLFLLFEVCEDFIKRSHRRQTKSPNLFFALIKRRLNGCYATINATNEDANHK